MSADASPARPLLVATGVTAVVTLLSHTLGDDYAATGVGAAFFAVTYWLTLRTPGDDASAHRYGLGLGGIFESQPLSAGRLASSAARALAWATATALVVFPPFVLGWLHWWQPSQPFVPSGAGRVLDDALGQVLVIALPEEMFYRGYLQTELDTVWKPRLRVLGANLGPGVLVASAIFALGHFLTVPNPSRLAVFFPALLFGWLRARTGGIGSAVLFHALCNLFASYLARSYGLAG